MGSAGATPDQPRNTATAKTAASSLLRIIIASLRRMPGSQDLTNGIAQAPRISGEQADTSVKLPVFNRVQRLTNTVGQANELVSVGRDDEVSRIYIGQRGPGLGSVYKSHRLA
jgi:hypothetical protein